MTAARHDAEIILVGSELLRGDRRDEHVAFLARGLRGAGARLERVHVVADDVPSIEALVRERAAGARVLLVTGGLGPTEDDITREGVAGAFDLPLEFDEPTWEWIRRFFSARGRTPTEANRRQAHFPRGAEIIANDRGTAPGFCLDAGGATVMVLPGPPGELQPMAREFVFPRVSRLMGRPSLRVETFRTVGVGESQLVGMLGEAATGLRGFGVSWLPGIAGVDIVLTETPGATTDVMDAESHRMHERLGEALGSRYYERGERALAKVVGDALGARGETVAVAESLTGGTVARLLTEHAGSSAYFLAAAVTYANASKVAMLGVRDETITSFGAVSEETCTEMAHGVRRAAGATWGLATTGIAGPGGATGHKPVGLTFIGVAWEGGVQVRRVLYPGDRAAVRDRAAHGVLWMLHDRLLRAGA